MSWRSFFWLIAQLDWASELVCMTGNSVAAKVWRENRLLPLCTTILLSLRLRLTGPSGKARKISNIFRAPTVVVTSSEPTPKFAFVVIWISISVETNEIDGPVFLNSKFARIASVWRRSTMPLTTCRGFSISSRVALISCIVFLFPLYIYIVVIIRVVFSVYKLNFIVKSRLFRENLLCISAK